jgi:hypothetical protein
MSSAVNHYYSSSSQISDVRHSSRAQVTSTQPGSHALQVTGTYYLCGHALSGTKSLSPASRQSSQPSTSQDPPLEEGNILCHCDLWGGSEADTICEEKGESHRME